MIIVLKKFKFVNVNFLLSYLDRFFIYKFKIKFWKENNRNNEICILDSF